MSARNGKGLLRWALVAGAAAIVFVGCGDMTTGTTDSGEEVVTPTQDLIVFNRGRVNTGIWRMYSNGTGQKAVTTPTGENGTDKDPVLSPDGTQIAFERNGDIWIVNNDGSELRNLSAGYTALSGKSAEREIAWSPDTSVPTIAFTRNATPQKYTDVYGLEIAQPGQESAGDLFPITNTSQVADSTPSWSPDGSEVVFVSRRKDKAGTTPSDNWDLFRTPAYDEGDISVLRRLTNTAQKNEVFPAWSPDDGDDNTPEWVAYHTQEGPKVVIRQIEGGAMGSTFDGTRPAWSIDGTELVWSQSDNIVRVPIDPANGTYGTATELTQSEDIDTAPNWGVVRSLVRAKSASLVEGEIIPGASSSYLEFKVELSAPSAQPISVPYEVFEDDAIEGQDYDGSVDPLSGTVQFDPGETQRVVKIAVIDDARDEPEQGLELELSEPTGDAILGIDYALGLIKDNDSVPVIEFDDVTVNENAGTATFAIDLVGESEWSIKLNYDHLVEGTTAVAGTDYTRQTGSVTFAAGQTHKEIIVPIADDAVDENDETFKMKLVREVSTRSTFEADGSPGIATGTIEDNDGTTPVTEEEIAFQRWPGAGPVEIWYAPSTGGPAASWQHPGLDFDPDWGHGANSNKLYFSSYGSEADEDIYVRNVDTNVVTKVQDLAGEQYAPTISPDGNLLAFQSDADLVAGQNTTGDFEIFVRNMTSGAITQVTSNTVEDRRPDWNPASNKLTYSSGSMGDIWFVDYPSGTPVNLTNTGAIDEEAPVWSPDGASIAFNSNEHGTQDIFVLNATTLAVERVTFDPFDESTPTFSPDGQWIAYSSRDGAEAFIQILDIAACDRESIVSAPDDMDSAPDWKNPGGTTPLSVPDTGCTDGGGGGGDDPINGDVVYISRTGEFASGDVHSMDVDGQNQETVTETTADESEVAWSPDGTKVAFVRGNDLWMRDAVTGVEEEIAPFMDGSFLSPSWHPTENAVAFANFGDSPSSTNDYDIYIWDMDDSSLTNLAPGGDTSDEIDPAWSSDGTQLAFSSDKAGVLYDLYTVDMSKQDLGGFFAWVGDNEQRRTALDFDALEANWSPEDDVIAFNGFEPIGVDDLEEEIFFLETSDDTVHQVTDTADGAEVSDVEPDFSPDGQTLMYSSDADGDPEIVTLDLSDCTTTTQLTTNSVWDTTPSWGPDSGAVTDSVPLCGTQVDGTGPLDPADAEIVYSKDEGTGWNLWIMNDDGSQETRLTDFTGNEMTPVWSPDGTLVAYQSDEGGDNAVFVLDPSAPFDGSNPVQVSTGDVWGDIAWTPDNKVAWVGTDPTDGDFDIYTADADGSNEGVLVNTDDNETDVQFFDDGGTTKVLFLGNLEGADDGSGGPEFDTEVWMMDTDGTNLEQVTHSVSLHKEHLSVTSDGSRIAFAADDGDIYTDDVDGTTVDEPTAQTTDGNAEMDNQPSWSADGTELVYVNFGGGGGNIFKAPLGDDSSRQQLTSDTGQEFSPDWKG